MSEELLTVAQTARYLQVCDKTVRRLIQNNMLTAFKVGSRTWRIRKYDIDEYLNKHRNENERLSDNE